MSKSSTTTIFTIFATTCLYGNQVVSNENKIIGLCKSMDPQLTSRYVANLWQICDKFVKIVVIRDLLDNGGCVQVGMFSSILTKDK